LRGCSIAGSDGTSPAPTVGGTGGELRALTTAEEVGFSAATTAEEGCTESLWAELPDELWAMVLEALPAAEQSGGTRTGYRRCVCAWLSARANPGVAVPALEAAAAGCGPGGS
jgi:hypothetical protein